MNMKKVLLFMSFLLITDTWGGGRGTEHFEQTVTAVGHGFFNRTTNAGNGERECTVTELFIPNNDEMEERLFHGSYRMNINGEVASTEMDFFGAGYNGEDALVGNVIMGPREGQMSLRYGLCTNVDPNSTVRDVLQAVFRENDHPDVNAVTVTVTRMDNGEVLQLNTPIRGNLSENVSLFLQFERRNVDLQGLNTLLDAINLLIGDCNELCEQMRTRHEQ